MSHRVKWAVFALPLVLVSGVASAERGAARGKLSHIDQKFVREAAQGGLAEVQLGQLAKDKAQSDEVKQFAQKMVDDHAKANEVLKSVAARENLTLPAEPNAEQKAVYDRLSKLSGAQFEREYMAQMVKDHDKTVDLFTREVEQGKNVELRDFAAQTLPTLSAHKNMAHHRHGSAM